MLDFLCAPFWIAALHWVATLSQAKDYNIMACSGEIKRDSTMTSSDSDAMNWMQDSFCIETSGIGKREKWIKLRLHQLRLPESEDCNKEKLVVFSDHVIQRPSSVSYCGQLNNVEIVVPSSRVVIRFEAKTTNSNDQKNRREFYLSYECFSEAGTMQLPAVESCRAEEYACHPRFYSNIQETLCLQKKNYCDGVTNCPYGDDEWKSRCQSTSSHASGTTVETTLQTETTLLTEAPTTTVEPTTMITAPTTMITAPNPTTGGNISNGTNVPAVNITCPAKYFLCKEAHRCIPLIWVCDNYPDCEFAEDEDPSFCRFKGTTQAPQPVVNPTTRSSPILPNCSANQFVCASTGSCILISQTCNGNNDCPNGEDEHQDLCHKKMREILLTTAPNTSIGNEPVTSTPIPVVTNNSIPLFSNDTMVSNITTVLSNITATERTTTNSTV